MLKLLELKSKVDNGSKNKEIVIEKHHHQWKMRFIVAIIMLGLLLDLSFHLDKWSVGLLAVDGSSFCSALSIFILVFKT